MEIGVETFISGAWRSAATLYIHEEAKGYRSPVTLDYDPDYFLNHAAIDFAHIGSVTDLRALSVRLPVDLATHYFDKWPSFLLDLMPQGHARRKLAEAMNLDSDARESDLPLLMATGGSTIGNIRIADAQALEQELSSSVVGLGVTRDEILDRSEHFMEVFDRFSMIASGSSGIQGEWPKMAVTLSEDGLYYPDALVSDTSAKQHFIIKLARSVEPIDHAILRLEAAYFRIASYLGLRVHGTVEGAPGVVLIPRFDRAVTEAGNVVRFGQESMVSALGVSEFGYVGAHESYIDVIKHHSTDPEGDIVEYVCRDVANLALGNSDNHGRNTALGKSDDGTIALTPVFDFAPMRLASEGIVRSTRWACMRRNGTDTLPDWKIVCDTIYPDNVNAAHALHRALQEFGVKLDKVPELLEAELGELSQAIARATSRCREIRHGLVPIANG